MAYAKSKTTSLVVVVKYLSIFNSKTLDPDQGDKTLS